MYDAVMLTTLQNLPKTAGIYQYFDAHNRLLYVGKAKNLFARVRSYFLFSPTLVPKPTLGARILKMLHEAVKIEYIIVDTEHDALILENALIKQLHPKYNILLRDDKTYPYLTLDTKEPFPRIELTRKVLKTSTITYFGPFSVGARDMIDAIYELVPLVQKKSCLREGKACLYFQIKKCLAPCEGTITPQAYAPYVQKAIKYIQNKNLLLKDLEKKMHAFANALRFEEAKIIRDQYTNIQKSTLNTPIDVAGHVDYDIFAFCVQDQKAMLVKLFMRNGRIISSTHHLIRLQEDYTLDELYFRAIIDFYTAHNTLLPKEILIYDAIEDAKALSTSLSTLAGYKVGITHPQKGEKRTIVELAYKNAQELLKQTAQHQDPLPLLTSVQQLLELTRLPLRIEVFDNSHLQGQAPVGAMICYDTDAFDKKAYRTFHLQATDEYGQMRETLSRRIAHFDTQPPPDLWLLDGGETLRKLAVSLLDEAGVTLDVVAIAKEKIDAKAHRAKGAAKDILYGAHDLFALASSDTRLHLLQKLRDEAHRVAITFHKKSKQKEDVKTQLLALTGIGPAKVKKLLNVFGSFEAIKAASIEELRSIVSEKEALLIKNHYT